MFSTSAPIRHTDPSPPSTRAPRLAPHSGVRPPSLHRSISTASLNTPPPIAILAAADRLDTHLDRPTPLGHRYQRYELPIRRPGRPRRLLGRHPSDHRDQQSHRPRQPDRRTGRRARSTSHLALSSWLPKSLVRQLCCCTITLSNRLGGVVLWVAPNGPRPIPGKYAKPHPTEPRWAVANCTPQRDSQRSTGSRVCPTRHGHREPASPRRALRQGCTRSDQKKANSDHRQFAKLNL